MAFRILALVTLVFAGTKTHHHDEFKNLPELAKQIRNQIKNVETVVNKCNKNEDGEVDSKCLLKEMGMADMVSTFKKEFNRAKTIVDECKANDDGKVGVKFDIKCALKKIGMAKKDVETLSNFLVTEFNRVEAVANECKQKEDGQVVDMESRVMCVLKKTRMLKGDAQNLPDIEKVLKRAMKPFASRFMEELPLKNEESSENGSSGTLEQEQVEEEEVPEESMLEEAFESSENSSTVNEEVPQDEMMKVEESEESTLENVAKDLAKLNIEEKNFLQPQP